MNPGEPREGCRGRISQLMSRGRSNLRRATPARSMYPYVIYIRRQVYIYIFIYYFYMILYYIVLYYILFYSILFYSIILFYIVFYYIILFRGLRPEAGNAGSRGDSSHILSFVAHTCARLSPLQKLDLLKKRERCIYIYIYARPPPQDPP